MYLQKNTRVCVLHAISPVHAGAGSATGAVDLPIQRERHTGWPMIQSSGVKGAFRDHCWRVWTHNDNTLKPFPEKVRNAEQAVRAVFGAKKGDTEAQAGAVAFSDARLLAFPVRANQAPFVWITCPRLIKRLAQDLELAGVTAKYAAEISMAGDNCLSVIGDIKDRLILEDICLVPAESAGDNVEALRQLFERLDSDIDRLVLVPDHHFSFLVETATEIQAQIAIDPKTGVTSKGSLRYQELLSADSVLYTLVFFGDERVDHDDPLKMAVICDGVKAAVSSYIQIGGDMTLGRGIFSVSWINNSTSKEG